MADTLKLPVGIDNFEEIRKLGFYYIDKTKLIEQLLYKHYEQKVIILIDKYDVPFDLMSKLMISVDNSKFYTRSAVVAKNVEKILNEGWLHFEAIREGLNHDD